MDEALTFCCSMFLEGIEMKFNRPNRNEDGSSVDLERQLSVFNSQCRPIGKKNFVHLDEKLRNATIWCILNNYNEIQTYLE